MDETAAVINVARNRGIDLTADDARLLLYARRIVADKCANEYQAKTAKTVTANYTQWFATGQRPSSFADLLLLSDMEDEAEKREMAAKNEPQ
jgi:hypothetical protein